MDITFDIPAGLSALHRFRALFGHCDTRVYLSNGFYVDVGRGSLDAVERLKFMGGSGDGCLGTIGQFCNFAPECALYGGGEHHNDLPVNVMLYNVPPLIERAVEFPGMRAKPVVPFRIGDAVLVCGRALVLAGAKLGDGSVLAAGGVLAGQVAPFTVAGGIPAKAIRPRVDASTAAAIAAVRWWDFDMEYMMGNLGRLQDLAVDVSVSHVYRKPEPRVILHYKEDGSLDVLGLVVDGVERPRSELPARFVRSLQQLAGVGPFRWDVGLWD